LYFKWVYSLGLGQLHETKNFGDFLRPVLHFVETHYQSSFLRQSVCPQLPSPSGLSKLLYLDSEGIRELSQEFLRAPPSLCPLDAKSDKLFLSPLAVVFASRILGMFPFCWLLGSHPPLVFLAFFFNFFQPLPCPLNQRSPLFPLSSILRFQLDSRLSLKEERNSPPPPKTKKTINGFQEIHLASGSAFFLSHLFGFPSRGQYPQRKILFLSSFFSAPPFPPCWPMASQSRIHKRRR